MLVQASRASTSQEHFRTVASMVVESLPRARKSDIIAPPVGQIASGALQHFPGVSQGLIGNGRPAQHAGDFLYPAFAAQVV